MKSADELCDGVPWLFSDDLSKAEAILAYKAGFAAALEEAAKLVEAVCCQDFGDQQRADAQAKAIRAIRCHRG